MDERTLRIVLKFDKDTVGLDALMAQLALLQGERGLAGVTREAEKASKSTTSFFDRLFGWIPGMRIFGTSLAAELVGGIAVAILTFAPYVAAAIAGMLNIAAMTAILLVGGGAIVALAAAFVGLGGGLTRGGALASANNQVATAAEAHENAIRKLQEGYVAWNSTASHTELQLMRLQDLQERVADTGAKLAQAQAKQGDAQADVSPMATKVLADFSGMADALRDKMRPGADLILGWIDSLIPKIGAMGMALVDWFTTRIPASLEFLGKIFDKVIGGSNGFGATIGKVVDYLLAHQDEFVGFFENVFTVAGAVFRWLMEAFINIHEWFKKAWPVVLGFIKAFQDGIGFWGPLLKPILKDIGDRLGDIFKNLDALNPLWTLMGAGIGLMVTVALSALDLLLNVIDAIITGLKWIEQNGGKGSTPSYVGHWQNDGRGHQTWVPAAAMTPNSGKTSDRYGGV